MREFEEQNLDRVCGIHSTLGMLRESPQKVRRVLFAENFHGKRLNEVRLLARELGVKTKVVPRPMLGRIAKGIPHQGVILEIERFRPKTERELLESLNGWEKPLILALDSIQDPRNLGACLRTAECAGVNAVIIGKNRCAPLTEVVHRTSSGAVASQFIAQVSNLARTLKHLSEEGCWIIGTDNEASELYTQADFNRGTVLVVGAEDKGLRRLTLDSCNQVVSIPTLGQVSSLNVSVATGVLLFEAVRSRS